MTLILNSIISFNYFGIIIIGKIIDMEKKLYNIEIELPNQNKQNYFLGFMEDIKILDIDETYFRLLDSVETISPLYA
jgi:hypothetical protein